MEMNFIILQIIVNFFFMNFSSFMIFILFVKGKNCKCGNEIRRLASRGQ